MISPDLIELLRCPQTGLPLALSAPQLLSEINGRIGQEGMDLHNQGGLAVTAKLDGGLVRADQGAVYPVRDGIPVLLADEAILLPLR